MNHPFLKFIIILTLILYSNILKGQIEVAPKPLELNLPKESTIEIQKQDEYFIRMEERQTAIVSIERNSFELGKEINLLLTILSPEKEIVEEINTANDASFVTFNSTIRGNYKVIVRRWNGAEKGTYKIELDYLKNESASKISQINNILTHFYESSQPGASILIQQNGETIYDENFGLSNLNYQIPISNTTVFDIASVSKHITAFSIAMLAVAGKLELNNSIRVYLPEFPEYVDNITVLHLVLNIGGVKEYDHILALSGYVEEDGDNITRDRILSSILQFEDTYFQPGTDYRYSNSGYFLLTEIIHRATGVPYPQWVKENIFEPLNMSNTYIFENDKRVHQNLSASYKKNGLYDNIKVPLFTYMIQSKNLDINTVHTTTTDFSKWMNNYREGKVGGNKTLKLIETGIHQDPESWNWAFGFQKTKHKGVRQKMSTGIIQGYRTYASYFPQQDISIIYLTNDGEWRTFYLASKLADILLQESIIKPDIQSRYSTEMDKVNDYSNDTINLQNNKSENSFEGVYYNDSLSKNLKIISYQDGIKLELFGKSIVDLEMISANEYETNKWYLKKIDFVKNENDQINACKIYNSRNGDFVLFKKIIE